MGFHEWLQAKEGIWLFYILILGNILETIAVLFAWKEIYWAKREFEYDEQKDLAKKQKRTKTTKKTTTQPGGGSIVEESTETVEPTENQEEKKK